MERILVGRLECIANEKCEFIHLSERYLQLTGYTRQEITTLFHDSFYEMLDPQSRAQTRAKLMRQITLGTDLSLEYRVYAKDGRLLHLYAQGDVTRETGTLRCCFAIANNSGYRELDSYYKSLLDSLPNPTVILDMEKRITFMNRAMAKETGCDPQDCVGKLCHLFSSTLCGTTECCVERYIRGEVPTIQITKDGRYNRMNLAPQLDSAGRQVGYISVSTDVTELVEAERALRLNEERYRIALGQTRSSIWEYDPATRTAYRSQIDPDGEMSLHKAYTDLPEGLIASGHIRSGSEDTLRKMFRDIHAGVKESGCTVHMQANDGRWYWTQLSSSTVFDEDGTILRVIGVGRDVTAEKERELRLIQEKRYRDSLASGALSTFEANLTQNRVTQLPEDWAALLHAHKGDSYDALLAYNIEQVAPPGSGAQLRQQFERKALLSAFYEGRREVSCEYQRKDPHGEMRWVCDTAYLVESAENGDVCALVHLKDIDTQKRQTIELKKKAERDPLTGLFNRSASQMRVERILSQEPDKLYAMFMLDIDNFKQINDHCGHQFGDAVLSETAERMNALFRRGDVLARMGGDEFMMFLRGIPNEETALRKAEQVCQQIRDAYALDGQSCEISGSLGVAFYPGDGINFELLYGKADAALYRAKELGKNQFAVCR